MGATGYTSASLRATTLARLRQFLRPGQSVDEYLNETMDNDLTYGQRLEIARREREEESIPWEEARESIPALQRRRR